MDLQIKSKIISLIILFSLIMPIYAFAEPVGTLLLEKGIVKLRRDNKDKIIKVIGTKVEIFSKDSLQTGKDSLVKIVFTGKDDAIKLFSQTFFLVESISKEKTETRLNTGSARFVVTPGLKIRKKSRKRFRVRTANAIIGVKGTDFLLSTGAEETKLLTISGLVSIANVDQPLVEVNVGANQASRIQKASRPTAAANVPANVVKKITTVDSPKAWNEVKFGKIVSPSTDKSSNKKSKKKASTKKNQQTKSSKKSNSGNSTKNNGKEKAKTLTQQKVNKNEKVEQSGSEKGANKLEQQVNKEQPLTTSTQVPVKEPVNLPIDNIVNVSPITTEVMLDTVELETPAFEGDSISDIDIIPEIEVNVEPDDILDRDAIIQAVDDSVTQVKDAINTKSITIKVTH